MMKLIGRTTEMNRLKASLDGARSELVLIYGPPRIGKTALAQEFLQDNGGIYIRAVDEPEAENQNLLLHAIAAYAGRDTQDETYQKNWEDILHQMHLWMGLKTDRKKVLIIDDAQYLLKARSGFAAALQSNWGRIRRQGDMVLVLVARIQESELDSDQLAIKGLRELINRMMGLKTIPFVDFALFSSNWTMEEQLMRYAITGGNPGYTRILQGSDDIWEALGQHVLDPNGVLATEPLTILRGQVEEIASYCAILKTIARGNHKMGQIAQQLHQPQSRLSKYLAVLMQYGWVERLVPITEDAEHSKKGNYYLCDSFAAFWFAYVYPHWTELALHNDEPVFEHIEEEIHRLMLPAYRDISRDFLIEMSKNGQLGFRLEKLGPWWDGKSEIDLVGLAKDRKQGIVFAQCLYREEPATMEDLVTLQQAAKKVPSEVADELTRFIVFSWAGFDATLQQYAAQNPSVFLV